MLSPVLPPRFLPRRLHARANGMRDEATAVIHDKKGKNIATRRNAPPRPVRSMRTTTVLFCCAEFLTVKTLPAEKSYARATTRLHVCDRSGPFSSSGLGGRVPLDQIFQPRFVLACAAFPQFAFKHARRLRLADTFPCQRLNRLRRRKLVLAFLRHKNEYEEKCCGAKADFFGFSPEMQARYGRTRFFH